MTEQQFIPQPYSKTVSEGRVSWESPSNIALVKYWGKKKNQIPENPSISFTLSKCKTITTVTFNKKVSAGDFDFEVFLDGEHKPDFQPKIETFFNRVVEYLPFLKNYSFKIETTNTFPHSSGIASSASGMSALALCLMSIEKQLLSEEISEAFFYTKASFLARLGSGSACRSLEGDLIVWGANTTVQDGSDLFGVKYPFPVHEHFKGYQDTILLVDKGEKQVSSTVGHNLMYGHPFAAERFKQAHANLEALKPVLESGDLDAFIALVESEALTLHAMMMTSMPYFILMKPNTLEVINKIWAFRKTTGLHVGFTLDAGANVHVLYPKHEQEAVLDFIKSELAKYCQNDQFICDEVGFGAQELTECKLI
ncbi:diphosphomevalonate/mevalonate 3,5-bisphosphate decarboxylase family protein [Formosa sp. S-31]|uniref:diphosphomevalonate/mevalonate 3,5-bisphosphate decarboxylase family protein n=1 Tax=Formosa sp. S-31 TaxID=2790949 RepID=UPI003EBF7CAF